MIYCYANSQWFFARLVRKDQPNTLFVWDGQVLHISHPSYIPSWVIKVATTKQLHSLIEHLWNAASIRTS